MMINFIYDTLQLIASQDWKIFRSTILSRPALFRELSNAVSSCAPLHGMTFLHAAVRYNAPLGIIIEMIRLCPDMPASKDCLGRTPLHVAAGSRASAVLLKILAHAFPTACVVQDDGGKTPLHFACDSSCVLFEEDRHNDSKQPPSHEAVKTLLSYSIYAATLEDEDEMTPLEYSILSEASLKTVKLLQYVTSKGMELSHCPQPFITDTPSLQPKAKVDLYFSATSSKSKTPDHLEYRNRRISLEDDLVCI